MIAESQRAWNLRRRIERWAGRNAFDQHVTKAELRWYDAYNQRMVRVKVQTGRATRDDLFWWRRYGKGAVIKMTEAQLEVLRQCDEEIAAVSR